MHMGRPRAKRFTPQTKEEIFQAEQEAQEQLWELQLRERMLSLDAEDHRENYRFVVYRT